MKKQYILFDFDGVIVNTEPQNAHYLQKTLKSFGIYESRRFKRIYWS